MRIHSEILVGTLTELDVHVKFFQADGLPVMACTMREGRYSKETVVLPFVSHFTVADVFIRSVTSKLVTK